MCQCKLKCTCAKFDITMLEVITLFNVNFSIIVLKCFVSLASYVYETILGKVLSFSKF